MNITDTADEQRTNADDVDIYRRVESISAYHHCRQQQKTNILLLLVFYKYEVVNKIFYTENNDSLTLFPYQKTTKSHSVQSTPKYISNST